MNLLAFMLLKLLRSTLKGWYVQYTRTWRFWHCFEEESVDEYSWLQIKQDILYVKHFTDSVLNFKDEMEPVKAPYKEMNKDMQKARHQTTPFFTKSSIILLPSTSTVFYHCNNFQPGAPASLQQTPTQMFTWLLIMNVHILMFQISLVLTTPSFP